MYYELNVSQNGNHLFATHKRSLISLYEYNKLLCILLIKFPESEGYKISGKHWCESAAILR